MKLILFTILTFALNTYCHALEIKPSLYLLEEKTVSAYVSKSNVPKTKITPSDLVKADKKQYIYKAIVYLTNDDKSRVKVITGSLSASRQKLDISDITEIKIHNRKEVHNDSLVIPSDSDLKLVELRPNETARFSIEIRSFRELQKTKFSYTIKDFYNNRYNTWSGNIESEIIETYN